MDRRNFVKASVAATVAATVPLASEAQAAPARKNVLYVFGDEHRWCSMPGQPHANVVAPTFDAFARQNFVMQNCISNYPLCTPYRGILLSGRWPQQTGLMRNGPDMALPASEHGLGTAFKEAGYNTAYVGKWHLYNGENHFVPPGPLRFGFDYWRVWGHTNKHFDDFTWDSQTGQRQEYPGWAPIAMTDQAITFLGQQTSAKPWMMVVSWNPPHPPFDPPEEDARLYDTTELPLRPNVAFTRTDGSRSKRPVLQNEATLRKAERGYFGAITGVDKEFRRLLDALEKTGQMENTIIIYTSDHGEMMGTKCRMAKQVPFEESCHVPFYIRIPNASNRGKSSRELMGAIDIYPTLCGLAGIPIPKHCQGRDMSPVMRGDKVPSSEGIILMNEENGDGNDPEAIGYRGIRTQSYTYAIAYDGRWCLYDNFADPFQMKNLVSDPTQKPLMEKLDAIILAWQKETGDKFPLARNTGKVSSQPT